MSRFFDRDYQCWRPEYGPEEIDDSDWEFELWKDRKMMREFEVRESEAKSLFLACAMLR